jgi:F-type H+-transporting ATPase subunit a
MKLSRRTRFIGILLAVILLIAIGYQFTVPLTHIQLPAEPVGRIPLPVSLPGLGSEFIITNSILAAWLSMLVLIVLSFFGTRKASLVPSKLQNLLEAVVEAILGLVENVAGHERGRRFFPLVATIFLFLLVSNWMGLLPGYGTIGWLEELHQGGYKVGEFFGIPTLTNEKAAGGEGYILVPFLRSAATDLNIPLALALISVGVTQMAGVVVLGLRGYGRKFINLGRLGRFFTQLIKGPRKALFMTFFSGFIRVVVQLCK